MRNPTPDQVALCQSLAPDVHYVDAYACVQHALMAAVPVDRTFSTEQLVELIAPADNWIHGAEVDARQRIFKALNALAQHSLKSWVTLAPPEKGRFGIMRRKVWRRPQVCPLCGK